MRTLDEVIKEYAIECGNPFGGNICAMDIEGVKEVANRFAQSVAQQALENASENFKGASQFATDVRESILNPDNIPTI